MDITLAEARIRDTINKDLTDLRISIVKTNAFLVIKDYEAWKQRFGAYARSSCNTIEALMLYDCSKE
jgi:hypothetical protein